MRRSEGFQHLTFSDITGEQTKRPQSPREIFTQAFPQIDPDDLMVKPNGAEGIEGGRELQRMIAQTVREFDARITEVIKTRITFGEKNKGIRGREEPLFDLIMPEEQAERIQENHAAALADLALRFPWNERVAIISPLAGAASSVVRMIRKGVPQEKMHPLCASSSDGATSGNAEMMSMPLLGERNKIVVIGEDVMDTGDTMFAVLSKRLEGFGVDGQEQELCKRLRENVRWLKEKNHPRGDTEHLHIYRQMAEWFLRTRTVMTACISKNEALKEAMKTEALKVLGKDSQNPVALMQLFAIAHMADQPENFWLVGCNGTEKDGLGSVDIGISGGKILGIADWEEKQKKEWEKLGFASMVLRVGATVGPMLRFHPEREEDLLRLLARHLSSQAPQ